MTERPRSAGDGAVDWVSPEVGGLEGLTPHRDDHEPALIELCVGTSLRVAPMEFLEAAVTIVQQAMEGSKVHAGDGAICLRPSNMAVVSTCNRVEFYLAVEADAVDEMIHSIDAEIFLKAADSVDLDPEAFVYVHHGSNAVRHLCRVAAGLDSLVVGEHEIAGQVSNGFARTVDTEGWNVGLIAMAEAARRASGRARTETGIGPGTHQPQLGGDRARRARAGFPRGQERPGRRRRQSRTTRVRFDREGRRCRADGREP